jgi:hypothetical protein
MVDLMYPFHDDNPTTSFPVAPTAPLPAGPTVPTARPRILGHGARIAVTATAATLLVAAGIGVGLSATDIGGDSHEVSDGMTQIQSATGHHDARTGPAGGAGKADPARKAWAQQYGQAFSSLADLPDIASASPEQQAAAADLLARSESATAPYSDVAAAKAAGFDLDAGIAHAEQMHPRLAQLIQAFDAGQTPPRMPMVHVANKANLRDGKVLDPSAPEVLMYEYQGHDTWKVIGVMFTANEIFPQAPPDPGGPIMRWHYHDKLLGQALMMHVFFVPGNDLAHAYALRMEGM